MNSQFIYEYIDKLERVLSFAIHNKISFDYIQKAVSYSSYFQKIEKSIEGYSPFIDDDTLIKSLFPEIKKEITGTPIYNECLWASEAYMRIQKESGLTFEAIFIYFPLKDMYMCFPIYHEMDFSHIVAEFCKRMKKQSVLSLLAKQNGYSFEYISEKTHIPYETLISLNKRRRDISKTSVSNVLALSELFNVRVETMSEKTFK